MNQPNPLNQSDSVLSAGHKDFVLHADEERAPRMQALMKSEVPFHGIPIQLRRELSTPHIKTCRTQDSDTYQERIIELWEVNSALTPDISNYFGVLWRRALKSGHGKQIRV